MLHDHGKEFNASDSYDFDALGVLARGHGEEEKDATKVSRHGVVDEEETTSFAIEAESPTV